ncbi:MAG: aldehyde dehydrogenase family protein, partial [Candidatus Obscuribacterales bacterium]|nr:aldehyde dehydrogenase family protein [Candidatus Obscuribacterales bacterium]
MLKEIAKYPLKIKGSSEGELNEVKSPYDGQPIAAVAQADEKAIKLAITQAKETFENVMRKMPAHKRSEILARTAKLLQEKHEDFARTIALEGGKPIRDARIEVSRAIMTFTIASEETLRLDGEQIAMDRQPGNEGRIGMILREPIGVIGAITPFNFPLNLVAHKLAPAFASGCTVVLKPASQTPVSSLKLAEVLAEAGLPEGALILTPCRGSKGHALVSDNRIALLTFTGSQEVGWRLRHEIAPGTRIILELGGNAGLVVHEDADLTAAAKAAARGGYVNAGQTCISVQRVYVQEKAYDKFLNTFVDLVKNLKCGDPLDESVDVGPMIDAGSVDKTLVWIDEAVKGGAKLLAGGKKASNNVLEPTVLAETKKDLNVVCQEVFGPVVAVMKYSNIDEAIALMNDSRYGLQAGVFTQNLEVAFKAARGIDAGGVMVNDAPTFRADHMPYGGRKESGVGLEGVRFAISEMTQPKFIC